MKKTTLCTALAAVSSAPLMAQESSQNQVGPRLETLVVVSSRQSEPLRQVATSVAVMDTQDIKARGFTTLADTLRTLPSVSVTRNGGMGKTSTLRVRGESGYRTLVRVDGIDVSDPSGPQVSAPIQHILSTDVGRVELLRGPQGMMYGADAGGVLDITTRRAERGSEFNLAAEGGDYGSARYNANLAGQGEKLDYFLSGAYAETDGYNTHMEDTELRDDDGYDNTTLHGRVGWDLTDAVRLEAVARDVEATNEFDQCGFPVTVDDCEGEFEQTNTRVSLAHDTGRLSNELSYTKTETERRNYAAGASSYDTQGELEKLQWIGSAELTDAHKLAYGLEQRTDQVMELERDQTGVYAEYQGNYADAFFVTAGVRHDDNDDFGTYNSYRVSAAYLVDSLNSGALKFKTSYGTGFRAPSLYEIDYNRSQNNPGLAPLEPEESEGLDIGVEYYGNSGLYLEAVVFDQRIDRQIEYDLVGFSGYLQSSGESQSRGVELTAQAPVTSTLQVSANATYIDAETAADSPRARVPEQLANLGLTYTPFDALKASLNLRASEGAQSTAGNPLDDYQVLDASVRYQLSPQATVYVRGENILDEDYVEIPNYRTAGATAYAGLELSF